MAATRPDSVAVRSSSRLMTYAELDLCASRVTGFLNERQVGRGHRVLVHLPRCMELLPVLLGTWGAGAAFVPVDETTPPDRLQRIVGDSRPSVIVTRSPSDFAHQDPRVVTPADALDADASPEAATADRPAYVLYTSGTTGEPKGVVVGVESLHRYLRWAAAAYHMHEGDGAPLFTSIAFDATLTSLFGPLLAGTAVTLVDEPDPVLHLAEKLRQGPDFSFVKATPHHVRLLAELLRGERLERAMRRLVVGGDEFDFATVGAWQEICSVPVVNEYGPTETVVGCTAFTVLPHDVLHQGASVPIGRAVADSHAHVLDDSGRAVAVGEVGELFVGGPSAANVYLDRPGMTAARFVPDPFDGDGARMYRTGDLASLRKDGVLEFHGRADRQIKVRGFRVELGEIETAVRETPGVVDAAASVDPTSHDVATVVFYTGEVEPGAVLADLRRRVPSWVVPGQLLRVDTMPTTANAKADIAALRSGLAGRGTRPTLEGLVDPLASELTAAFSALLPDVAIGPDSHFFGSGGNSMSGIRLVARLRKAGHDVSPADLTASPTPRSLAELIVGRGPVVARGQQALAGDEIELTPAQRDFFALDLPQPGHWNQQVVVAAPDGFDRDRLRSALDVVSQQHDVLRYRFRSGHQVHVGGPAAVAFSEVRIADRAALADTVREVNAGLDLEVGPLVRWVLVHLDGAADHLILVAHHLVVDEVSWTLILDDLVEAYRSGAPAPRDAAASAFAAWRSQLARFAQRPDVLSRRTHWEDVLAMPVGRLDRNDTPDDYSAEHYVFGGLDFDATARLTRAAEEARIGVHEILLAGMVGALQDLWELDSLRVDVESHGRVDIGPGVDTSRVMGWCTAVFPVVLTGNTTVELARSARDVLGALPWHGTEFGLLRPAERAPSRCSEVLFNYLGRRQRVLHPELGWTLEDPVPGAQAPSTGRRPYVLELQARTNDGRIQWEWRAGARHSTDVVGELSERLRTRLITAPGQLAADRTIRYATSGLSPMDLMAVLNEFSGPTGGASE